ncbi:expressed conserved protein [Echinococcus multilocularis]|uniref:Expressed conserved protein n=1 Tax=Echinococcus multilocularis TaxID=6211 RepID=A0A087W0Q1_ECHMU|nr:expressed conserved protein [Echinococcus multilocularis]
MSFSNSRFIHLSNLRRESSSTIYELLDDSESSTSSSSEDDYWVALSFHHAKQLEKHKSKTKAKAHAMNDSKEIKKRSVYFVLDEDRHSLVSRETHHRSHKSHKKLPRKEKLDDSSRYSLVATSQKITPKPVKLLHKYNRYDSESEPIILPIQRKMRSTHCEGVYEGTRPRRSVSAVPMDKKPSHSRRRRSSEVVRSVDMSGSSSRLSHKAYSVNQDTNMQELAIDMPDRSSSMKNFNKKPQAGYGIAILKRY